MQKLFSCLAISLMIQTSVAAQNNAVADPPLRTDSLEIVIADLEAFIPAQMAQDGVTGVSCALIHGGKIVWTRGFGITNSLSRSPVTPQTVFSAASLGKPVAAFLAVKMVEQGWLSLDEPLSVFCKRPWLPRSADHDAVTLRHVLTHTSGLSNFLRDQKKNLKFKPGEQFAYSGVGFMYLQAALEQTSGRSLDDLAREQVLEPLGMASAYFDQPLTPVNSLAYGHGVFARTVAPFGIIFTPALAILVLLGTIVTRWRKGQWQLSRATLPVSFLLAAAGTFCFLVVMAGGVVLASYFTFCALAPLAVWLLLAFAGARVLQKFIQQRAALLGAKIAWCLVSLVLLFMPLRNFPTPLLNWFPPGGNAASSLRATPSDLAHFLIELMEAKHLNKDLMAQLQTPQVKANEHVSWGLGIGIQHSAHGDCLWHWGSNPGSKNIMVVYPAQRSGIVVLCNSSQGENLIVEIARCALGGKAYWDS
jgi:CubicO group peptidase (beta-lactamase class C family)